MCGVRSQRAASALMRTLVPRYKRGVEIQATVSRDQFYRLEPEIVERLYLHTSIRRVAGLASLDFSRP